MGSAKPILTNMSYSQGLTLEQIDEVFSEPNPRKYSVEHAATLKAKKQETTA